MKHNIIKYLESPSKYIGFFHLFQNGRHFILENPIWTDSVRFNYWLMSKQYLRGSQEKHSATRNQIRKLLQDATKGKIIKVPFCMRKKYFPINGGRKEYKIYIELK